VTAGNTATLEGMLWYGNGSDTGGGGSIFTGTVNVYGDPAFFNPTTGNYHLGPGSAAKDVGVDAGVTTDIDGYPRPQQGGYDIGRRPQVPSVENAPSTRTAKQPVSQAPTQRQISEDTC